MCTCDLAIVCVSAKVVSAEYTGRHDIPREETMDFQHGTVLELKPCQALYILDTSTISSHILMWAHCVICASCGRPQRTSICVSCGRPSCAQALPVSSRGLATLGYSSLIHRVLCGINSTQNANANPLH